jgi:subtilisin family serine protease
MKNRILVIILLGVLLLTIVGVINAQDTQDGIARNFVIEAYALGEPELVVDYKLKVAVPGMGVVTQYKLRDERTDQVYGSFIDEAGLAWTPEEFRIVADEAYQAQYGKFGIPLFKRYEESPDTPVPVEIWLIVEDSLFAGLRGPDFIGSGLGLNEEPATRGEMIDNQDFQASPEEIAQDPALIIATENVNAAISEIQVSLLNRLAAMGIDVKTVQQTPLLSATLTRNQALKVAENSEVGRIFLDDIENKEMNSSAQITHRAHAVWGRGYTGSGASIAILEADRADINFWLYNYVNAYDWSGAVSDHATRVMGIINSSHGVHHGIARGASIYSANSGTFSTANLQSAAIWATDQGVHIINNSWGATSPTGCLSSLGMFFDYRVLANRVLITHSAGNSGELIDDHAMAYNNLAVGSFNDKNNASWSDDSMSDFSAWQEGTGCSISNGDRQKPDLVAVGELIRSTIVNPPSIDYTDQRGTSFTAPMVAGEAALMIEIDPNLAYKPEAMRAILMASAVNNIEGPTRLSEYDGAGGIDAYSAYLDVLNGRYAQMMVNPSTFTSYDYTFYAGDGEPISCAIAWTSHPNASYTSDPLLTDFDLRLYDPSLNLISSSTSSSNSYEIVRAMSESAGTWTCRVSKYSSSGTTWEYLGIAVDRAFQNAYDYPYIENALFMPLLTR